MIIKQVIGTALTINKLTISSLIMVAYQGQERCYNVFIVIQWNIYIMERVFLNEMNKIKNSLSLFLISTALIEVFVRIDLEIV